MQVLKLCRVHSAIISHSELQQGFQWCFILPKCLYSRSSAVNRSGTHLLRDSNVVKVLPEDVTSEHTIELRLWRRLPLHHNGLICAATGYYVFRWSTGRLFPQHQSTGEGRGKIGHTVSMSTNYSDITFSHPHTSGFM